MKLKDEHVSASFLQSRISSSVKKTTPLSFCPLCVFCNPPFSHAHCQSARSIFNKSRHFKKSIWPPQKKPTYTQTFAFYFYFLQGHHLMLKKNGKLKEKSCKEGKSYMSHHAFCYLKEKNQNSKK